MKRYLSPRVVVNGTDHGMKIVEISDDGSSLRMLPFTREVHSTAFVDSCLRIEFRDGKYHIVKFV